MFLKDPFAIKFPIKTFKNASTGSRRTREKRETVLEKGMALGTKRGGVEVAIVSLNFNHRFMYIF